MDVESPFMSKVFCEVCKKSQDPHHEVFCSRCGALYAPNPLKTHFEVLGVEETFSLCPEVLESAYLDRQRCLHPDKFVLKTEQERGYAQAHTVALNVAYQVLKDSHQKGKYLLKLKGFEDPQDSGDAMDAAFLLEIMEERERMESLQDVEEIQFMMYAVQLKKKTLEEALKKAFEEENYKKVTQLLNQFQYNSQFYKTLQKKQG